MLFPVLGIKYNYVSGAFSCLLCVKLVDHNYGN
jgi:hypothetical protein